MRLVVQALTADPYAGDPRPPRVRTGPTLAPKSQMQVKECVSFKKMLILLLSGYFLLSSFNITLASFIFVVSHEKIHVFEYV